MKEKGHAMFYIKEYVAGKFFPLQRHGEIKTFQTETEAKEYLDKYKATGHINRGSKVAKQK